MGYQSFDEAFNSLPPISENNSRSIVREWIKNFRWSKGEFWAHKIETVLGIDIDWSDKDYGEPPANYKLEE